MVHQGSLPSGAQEWACPTCGRQFVVQWPPNYQRIVLCEGDSNAAHTGATGDVQLSGEHTTSEPSPEAEQAWRRWLDDNGIAWDGDDQVD
jgi:hypothetical protein